MAENDIILDFLPADTIELVETAPDTMDLSLVQSDEISLEMNFGKGDKGDPGDDGTDGRDIELNKSSTHIQWRYVGDLVWIDLVPLSDITGADGYTPIKGVDYFDGANGTDGTNGTNGTNGREVEIQNNGTYIQWRYTGGAWTNLVALSTLKGDTGSKGDKGDAGTPGTNGINGKSVTSVAWSANNMRFTLSDASTIDLPDAKIDLKGEAGIDGTDGTDGAPGSVWREAAGAPSDALGINGDFYLNITTWGVYYKSSGTYSVIGNIKGGQGDKGEKGDTGNAGADGRTILNGSGAPGAGIGSNGDYYLDNDTSRLYLKAGGTWSSYIVLKIPVSTTAPVNPNVGDLWVDSN